MATVQGVPKIELVVTLALNEKEAAALHALASFKASDVLGALGTMSPGWVHDHKEGFTALMDSIRNGGEMRLALQRVQDAREVFRGTKMALRMDEGAEITKQRAQTNG